MLNQLDLLTCHSLVGAEADLQPFRGFPGTCSVRNYRPSLLRVRLNPISV
ncbi:hypothetical protein Hanom_Chr03g00191281 [Helianthus anomalus]